jgi:hypothetical protein
MRHCFSLAIAAALLVSTPAAAQNPRDLLLSAAFTARDKPTALARVTAALKASEAMLARNPRDRQAQLQRAIAIGYRGKLTKNPGDAKTARRAFESLAASNPGDAEAQLALGGWHLQCIMEVGSLVARTVLGARKPVGLQALDRAIARADGRALFPAYVSLIRIQLDSNDVAGARRFAEAALKARVETPEDRVMQQAAAALLVPLRAGNGKAAAALAEKLKPFGRLAG